MKATIGKKVVKLIVIAQDNETKKSILTRNLLKYLPWEIAHTGVHWLMYFDSTSNEIPIWTWFLLIVPQVLVVIYFVSILLSKGQTSIYNRILGIKLQLRNT